MNKNYKPSLISIIGPTAVGKTKLAIDLALKMETEIVSADSRQFYRELIIGTGKPSEKDLNRVKHHFINSHSIKELYSAGQFERDVTALLSRLFNEYHQVIAVGGSGLYLKALWEGFDEIPPVKAKIREELIKQVNENKYKSLLSELQQSDPTYYAMVDKKNVQRVIRALEVIRGTGTTYSHFRKSIEKKSPYYNIKVGLNIAREELFDRINHRTEGMIKKGLFDEVRSLYNFKNHNALQTVGYSEIFNYIDGACSREEAIQLLKRNTRRYAKRQMTWLRRYKDIAWFKPHQKHEIMRHIQRALA